MATALVTGGTSGIGAAFARALAARGDDLVLVARDAERLAEMATGLKERYGADVEILPADLRDRDDTLRVAERVESAAQPIDLLVNNAGFGVHTKLLAPDTSRHEQAIDLMERAVLILGGAAGRAMKARGHGAIVNVSSTSGFVTMGSYSAIKAWATSYSEALAIELAGSGVTVTALCPGYVRTEFHERADINASKIPGPLWLDADVLVAGCLADVAKGRVISIPTARWKFLIVLARHAPRPAIYWASKLLSSGRHPS